MMPNNSFLRFTKKAIAYSLTLSIIALALSFFPSKANASIFDCMGPLQTMEVTDWNMQGGPSVPLSYWSSTEQAFLREYIDRFHKECMGIELPDTEEDKTVYGRDGSQDILDRARLICQNKTGGYGTNWDSFVRKLEAFTSLCRE